MPAPATVDDFLELVRKSGVADEPRLDAYVQKLRADNALPAEPAKAAGLMVRDGLLTQFQAEQFLLGKWKNFTIGKYKVLERVGSGGMGSVYLCEHKFMRRRVAVKVLPIAKANDPASLERFYREARAVAALDHPNIVRAYDIDQHEKLHFLVMEYVDGASLQEIVRRSGPMDPVRTAHYISDAAEGLQHAHVIAALVHRDIKPGNILVDRGGQVKVLDMGLARFFNDEIDQITKQYDENVLGTADYLAPEQALDSHTVDIRADIYGLGATFYFCLTGKTPFSEGTVAQKLIWHQTRQPKPIQSFRGDVPEGLLAVINKMMAKDPTARYQTPAEVVAALSPWTGEPIGPPPDSEMPQLSPAAMGNAVGGSSGNMAALTGGPAPSSKVRKNWKVAGNPPSSGPKPPPAPAPTPAPTVVTKAPSGPVAPQPTAAVLERAAPAADNGMAFSPAAVEETDEQLAWEQLAAETQPPAKSDTAPRSGGKKKPAPKSKVPAPRQPFSVQALLARIPQAQRRWWMLGAAGAALLVVVAVLWWSFFGGTTRTSRVDQKPSERLPLTVSKAGKGGAFPSVRAALLAARPRDRVVILDDEIQEERLDLGGENHTDVTVESGIGRHVLWLLPEKLRDKPHDLVLISGASGVTLKGFTFDGRGRVADLVVVTGHCPGTRLEDLTLQGFTGSGVKFVNGAGSADRPLTLRNVRAVTKSSPAAAGLLFDLLTSIANPKDNENIRVEDAVLDGFTVPVQVKYAALNPTVKLPPGTKVSLAGKK